MTTVEGTYALCGTTWALDFTCSGPQCSVFADFPDVTCVTANGVTTCSSLVPCDGPVDFSSAFSYTQPGSTSVTSTDSISLPNICEQIQVVSDFSVAGTTVTGSDVPACVPDFGAPASCFPVSSSSVAPSSVASSSAASSSAISSSDVPSSSVPSAAPSSSAASSSVAPSSVASSSAGPSSISSAEPSYSSASSSALPSSTESSSAPPSSTEWCYESSIEFPTTGPWPTEPSPSPDKTSSNEPRTETSTILSTRTYTITSCKPTITNCPLGRVTTEVVTSYSTYCSDDDLQGKPGAPKTGGIGGDHKHQAATNAGAPGAVPTGAKVGVAASKGGDVGVAAPTTGKDVLPLGSGPAAPAPTIFGTAPLSPVAPLATVYTAGARSTRPPTVGFMWCSLLLVFGFLAQGIAALAPPPVQHSAIHNRQVVGNAVSMADKLISHFNGVAANSDLAESLIRSILDIGCDLAIEDECGETVTDIAQSKAFAVEFTTSCRTVITSLVIASSPENSQNPGTALLLSVDAGLLCNFMLGSFFNAPELLDGVCAYPKPCSADFSSDSQNCGRCGNVCTDGSCQGSACPNASCTGQTCDTFTACGPGGSCVCASTTGGMGFCADGQTPCAGLADCESSADCAAGEVCAVNTCCSRNICIAATANCAGTGPGLTPALLLARTWENTTVGDRGVWVS
ncbi:hypothetical protein QBC34DRAFT_443607 [Podospora aff. communis PSN243]|uniref:Uncharacterized protein n=1 Tax=Podospora aff. communis PSN243 TaxID=3040156 RepID=A0AAV9G499_9PEZI|nr:hypothetical protein QBC34DRAFT_443607 [Podospora aff. communis PSN243]